MVMTCKCRKEKNERGKGGVKVCGGGGDQIITAFYNI